jgi:hypothetical protein
VKFVLKHNQIERSLSVTMFVFRGNNFKKPVNWYRL